MRPSSWWLVSGLVFAAFLGLSLYLMIVHGQPYLFFVLPFIPIAIRPRRFRPSEPPRLVCAQCGWSTTDQDLRFCPRDGSPLPRPQNPFDP